MLAGLEQPTRGTISVGDRVVNDLAARPARHRHGVPVLRALSAHDGGAEHRVPAAQARRRPGRSAASRSSARRPSSSSRRCSTASRASSPAASSSAWRWAAPWCAIRRPSCSTSRSSNLDAKLRAHMRAELIELHQRIGKTMIYVTHDQLEAMTMSDRIAVLDQGRLQQFDTPQEIYRRPVSLFVAGFIGTPAMNFIKGTLQARRQPAGLRGRPAVAETAAAARPPGCVARRGHGRDPGRAVRGCRARPPTASARRSRSSSRRATRASCSST